MWLISWLVFYPLYIFCECHGLRGSIFIWHWITKGEWYVFAITFFYKLQFFFLLLVLPSWWNNKRGRSIWKYFQGVSFKIAWIYYFCWVFSFIKKGEIVSFLEAHIEFFNMFCWKTNIRTNFEWKSRF